jgi:hypothetical protein
VRAHCAEAVAGSTDDSSPRQRSKSSTSMDIRQDSATPGRARCGGLAGKLLQLRPGSL